jgi:hypothetical protein
MTTSGTNSFNPSSGELVAYAYSLIGIRRPAITQEHLVDARMATNIMLAEWNNDTPNLWKVDLVETPLVEGVASYTVDAATIMILDAYIRTDDGNGNPIDRIIWPISRTEYASMSNKEQQGQPTSFWFDRLLSPTITLWTVPDGNGPYLLRYYRVTQIYDVSLQGGQTVDIPSLWFGAFAWGLALRLAYSYAPEKIPVVQPMADKSLMNAMEQNVENVPLYISPAIGGYYVR